MLAAMRSQACIIHVDGHDHGDTHCVVRIDDLMVLVEECYAGTELGMRFALADSALEGVLAALDRADSTGEPVSSAVLRGILAVYSKAGEQ